MPERLKIGEILVRTGLIQESQLRAALGEQRQWGGRIGVTLVKMGFLSEDDLVRALGSHFGIPVVRLAGKKISAEVLSLMPAELAEKHGCIPLFIHWEDGAEVLFLGMEDPGDLAVLDDVRFRTGLQVKPVLVGPVQLRAALTEFYGNDIPDPDRDLPAAPGAPTPSHASTQPRAAVPAPPPPQAAAPDPAPPPAAVAPAPADEPFDDLDDATQTFVDPLVDPNYEQTFDAIDGALQPPEGGGTPEADANEVTMVGAPPAASAVPAPEPEPEAEAAAIAEGGSPLDPEPEPAQEVAPAVSPSLAGLSTAGLSHMGVAAENRSRSAQATREILRALTKLLVQKGIVTRDELVAAVKAERSESGEND